MRTMPESPFAAALSHDSENVVRREIVTYRMKEGQIIKEEVTRDYYKDGDFHDTMNSKPLIQR